jgi:hypothetical protein
MAEAFVEREIQGHPSNADDASNLPFFSFENTLAGIDPFLERNLIIYCSRAVPLGPQANPKRPWSHGH